MHNLIFPEHIKDPPKQVRGAKEFTVIAPSKKKQDVMYFHCPRHRGLRLLPGNICQLCGPTMPATKEVQTVEDK